MSPIDFPDVLEWSDDRNRGRLPHIQRAIAEVRGLSATPCSRQCGRDAMSLMMHRSASSATATPLAMCERCAEDWRQMSRTDRDIAAVRFERRGRL